MAGGVGERRISGSRDVLAVGLVVTFSPLFGLCAQCAKLNAKKQWFVKRKMGEEVKRW